MTEKEKYIKNAFKNYKLNKKKLRNVSFDGLHAIDCTKVKTGKNTSNGQENAIVSFLDEKARIEKEIKIVEHVLWFYELDGGGKREYIVSRWIKGFPNHRAAMDCYISEATGYLWTKEILQVGIRAADLYNLW